MTWASAVRPAFVASRRNPGSLPVPRQMPVQAMTVRRFCLYSHLTICLYSHFLCLYRHADLSVQAIPEVHCFQRGEVNRVNSARFACLSRRLRQAAKNSPLSVCLSYGQPANYLSVRHNQGCPSPVATADCRRDWTIADQSLPTIGLAQIVAFAPD